MVDASIHPATSDDRTAIVALLEAAGLPHDLPKEILPEFRVLRVEGSVRGVVGLEPVGQTALLRSLAVDPAVQGQGYGTALVREAEAHAREQGLDVLYLLTTTAAGFFAELGYKPAARAEVPSAIAQTDEFARLCPDTATCMQKSLTS